MSQEQNYFVGQELLHTPGGVRDIYGAECASKKKLQGQIQKVFSSHGFRDIQTPTFEYFDIFSKERGTVQSNAMFKFFDRGNNTLVLRPDITPSIARCVAKYYREEEIQLRLCYMGETFVNTSPYKGKLQEVTQLGAELINDNTSDADAEMVAMTVECLLTSGLKEFQIEVGHADLLPALMEEAGLSPEEAQRVKELIESKNFFGVEDYLDQLTVTEDLREIFLKLPELLGDLDEAVEFVQTRTGSDRVLKALDRLIKLSEIIDQYGYSQYVSVDLSMLSHYSYYTGVIFRAYTYGNGEALASGGRYDGLLSQFGKEAPAIGIALVIDQLMLALDRQHLLPVEHVGGTIVLYSVVDRKKALEEAARLRSAGERVQLIRKSSHRDLKQYQEYRDHMGMDRLLYVSRDGVETLA